MSWCVSRTLLSYFTIRRATSFRLIRKLSNNSRLCQNYQLKAKAGCLEGGGDPLGLVLGLYSRRNDDPFDNENFILTEAADRYNKFSNCKLLEMLRLAGPVPKHKETRIFYGLEPFFTAVAVVGLGDECPPSNEAEQIDEGKEIIREAAAAGCQALQKIKIPRIYVESFGHAESAAEGSTMGVWVFQNLKNEDKRHHLIPKLELHDDKDYVGWQIGLQKGAAQNLARQLCETPANLMTPTAFAQNSVEVLCKAGVNVSVRVQAWAKMKKMNAFLMATNGSCESPIFMETSYYGCEPNVCPIILVGKGVTFNSGGLNLKECADMKHQHGEMSGAACVVAACRAASELQLPLNIRGLIPLCENMLGANSMRPGDVVTAQNGKAILIENTEHNGRLIMADALCHAQTFNPKYVIDIGTLDVDTQRCMGSAATAAFTNSENLWEQMRVASIHTGDRIWRFPLWNFFGQALRHDCVADVRNGCAQLGGPCRTASFLREFVPKSEWIHLDNCGVARTDGESHSYLRQGMTGRPTRTLIEFLAQIACNSSLSETHQKIMNKC